MQSCGRALERRMGFSVLTRRTCLYHGGLRDALRACMAVVVPSGALQSGRHVWGGCANGSMAWSTQPRAAR